MKNKYSIELIKAFLAFEFQDKNHVANLGSVRKVPKTIQSIILGPRHVLYKHLWWYSTLLAFISLVGGTIGSARTENGWYGVLLLFGLVWTITGICFGVGSKLFDCRWNTGPYNYFREAVKELQNQFDVAHNSFINYNELKYSIDNKLQEIARWVMELEPSKTPFMKLEHAGRKQTFDEMYAAAARFLLTRPIKEYFPPPTQTK